MSKLDHFDIIFSVKSLFLREINGFLSLNASYKDYDFSLVLNNLITRNFDPLFKMNNIRIRKYDVKMISR